MTRTSLAGVLVLLGALLLVTGTGAFSTVTTDRTASIGVAGDDSALLQLTPYAGPDGNGDIADGQLQISNLNVGSSTTFAKVFNVTNHGTQTVAVWIVDDGQHPDAVTFYNPDLGGATVNGGTTVEEQENAVDLDVGETLVVSLAVDTSGIGEGVGLIDEMVVHADASVDGAPGPGDPGAGDDDGFGDDGDGDDGDGGFGDDDDGEDDQDDGDD